MLAVSFLEMLKWFADHLAVCPEPPYFLCSSFLWKLWAQKTPLCQDRGHSKWDWSYTNNTDVQSDVPEEPVHRDCKWHEWRLLMDSSSHWRTVGGIFQMNKVICTLSFKIFPSQWLTCMQQYRPSSNQKTFSLRTISG